MALTQNASFGPGPLWIAEIGLASRIVQIPAIFLVGFESPFPFLVAGVAAFLAGCGIWLLLRRADGPARRGALLAAGIGAAGVLLPLVLSLAGVDNLLYKNVMAAVVPLTIALAAGFAAARAGRLGAAAAASLVVLSLAVVVTTAWVPKYHREAWREAAHALGGPAGPRAVVATPGPAGREPLTYYLPGARKLRGGWVWVSEVDVLALRHRSLGAMTVPQLPRVPRSPAPPPGYRLVERRDEQYFRLFRFRAPRPLRTQFGELEGSAVDTVSPIVLVQR